MKKLQEKIKYMKIQVLLKNKLQKTKFRNKRTATSFCEKYVSEIEKIDAQPASIKEVASIIKPYLPELLDEEIDKSLSLFFVTLIVILAYIITVLCLVIFYLPS